MGKEATLKRMKMMQKNLPMVKHYTSAFGIANLLIPLLWKQNGKRIKLIIAISPKAIAKPVSAMAKQMPIGGRCQTDPLRGSKLMQVLQVLQPQHRQPRLRPPLAETRVKLVMAADACLGASHLFLFKIFFIIFLTGGWRFLNVF